MTDKRTTRRSRNLHRVKRSPQSETIIAEIQRAEFFAGIIIAIAFGFCMFWGLM